MYKVTISIQEILERKITQEIEAESLEEAREILLGNILSDYKQEKIILDADDFVDVIIEVD